MKFHEWIKSKREANRLSQEECAAKANVSQSAWQRYEAVDRSMQRVTVEKIAHALGVPPAEALTAAGFAAKTWVEPDAELTNIVYSVHPAQRAALVQAVKAMAQALNASHHAAA